MPKDLDEDFSGSEMKLQGHIITGKVLLFTMISLAQGRGSSFEFGAPTHNIFVSSSESTLCSVWLGGMSINVWDKGKEIFSISSLMSYHY